MITEEERETFDEACKEAYNEKSAEPYTWADLARNIIWKYFFLVVVHHVILFTSLYMYAFRLHSVPIKRATVVWATVLYFALGIGIVAGAHRLWSHRSYKANLALRILLSVFFTTAGYHSLYHWIRDHRVHHRYSETDADPHNAKRGFWFAHIGWIVMKRHPECLRRGREMDMSDIEADPVVMFQKKYAFGLKMISCFIVPTVIPIILWEETILHAVLTQIFIRFWLVHHAAFIVNSIGHLWGSRPYNRLINPVDNVIISLLVVGEGSHNYHHTFPWDYKASELPYGNFNITTLFIDAMAKLGWAYDLRQSSPELVEKVVRRIGYKSKLEADR